MRVSLLRTHLSCFFHFFFFFCKQLEREIYVFPRLFLFLSIYRISNAKRNKFGRISTRRGEKASLHFFCPRPPSSGAKETTNIGDQNFSCFPFVTRQQQQIIVFVQHSIKLLKNVRIFLTQGRYIYFGDDFMNGLRDICMLICNTLLY